MSLINASRAPKYADTGKKFTVPKYFKTQKLLYTISEGQFLK